MSVSGYDDKFLFYGFLPKKEGELENVLSTLSKLDYSQIFFVPAVKINFYLKIMKKHYFDRKIMIAKEITKIHEEFFRDSVKDIKLFNPTLKGELTIVISENISKNNQLMKKIVNKIKKYLKNYSLKDTVELILETENINKNKIYQLCLKVKNERIIKFLIIILLTSCSSVGQFGAGVDITFDPRTIGMQIDDTIMQKFKLG